MGGLFHSLRHPRRCYVVCTIPRAGSNLLTDGLRATRRAGVPKQFFLPKSEARYGAAVGLDPVADYPGYVRSIVNAKTSQNEVFGFKLMSGPRRLPMDRDLGRSRGRGQLRQRHLQEQGREPGRVPEAPGPRLSGVLRDDAAARPVRAAGPSPEAVLDADDDHGERQHESRNLMRS